MMEDLSVKKQHKANDRHTHALCNIRYYTFSYKVRFDNYAFECTWTLTLGI